MPSFDLLNDFLSELNAWSRPVNVKPINYDDEKSRINRTSSHKLKYLIFSIKSTLIGCLPISAAFQIKMC